MHLYPSRCKGETKGLRCCFDTEQVLKMAKKNKSPNTYCWCKKAKPLGKGQVLGEDCRCSIKGKKFISTGPLMWLTQRGR